MSQYMAQQHHALYDALRTISASSSPAALTQQHLCTHKALRKRKRSVKTNSSLHHPGNRAQEG